MVKCRSGFEKLGFCCFRWQLSEKTLGMKGEHWRPSSIPQGLNYVQYLQRTWQKHWGAWLLYRSLESVPVWLGQRESIMTHILPSYSTKLFGYTVPGVPYTTEAYCFRNTPDETQNQAIEHLSSFTVEKTSLSFYMIIFCIRNGIPNLWRNAWLIIVVIPLYLKV